MPASGRTLTPIGLAGAAVVYVVVFALLWNPVLAATAGAMVLALDASWPEARMDARP